MRKAGVNSVLNFRCALSAVAGIEPSTCGAGNDDMLGVRGSG